MRLNNKIFFAEVEELLAEGRQVTILVRGNSMRPLLRDGRDKVILRKANDEDIKIGAVLKKYRKEKRLTIRKIGDILGINNSTVSKWESGINAISAKDLLHYLDILGITYEQFIEDLKAMDGELTL